MQATPALAFLLIVLARTRASERDWPNIQIPQLLSVSLIALLPVLLFWHTLTLPFTHDTCGLVWTAAHQSFVDIIHLFAPPPMPPDFFFRPLAYGAFWIYAKWAHLEPVRWNAWCLGMHILNSLLVYALARQLSLKPLGATVASLFFALHGTRAEAVAWPPVRVDLLAMFFVLLTLLAVNSAKAADARPEVGKEHPNSSRGAVDSAAVLRGFLESRGAKRCLAREGQGTARPPRRALPGGFLKRVADGRSPWWLGSIAITAAAACLSKEAAYGLPLIALAMLFSSREKKKLPATVTLVAVCAACFLYRLWVLGGIGGYGTAEGKPAALHFSLLRLINGLLYRQWAFLFFPINWSEPPGVALWIGLAAMCIVLLLIALFWIPSKRRQLACFLLMTIAAALPAYQLLFLNSDLNGARVLYLPALGLALFWGLVICTQISIRRQLVLAGGLLLFQGAALAHNLGIWREGSLLAQSAYREIGAEVVKGEGPMAVENLPATWRGVFFLKNSFPLCVLLNSGDMVHQLPDIREIPIGAKTDAFARVYRWNDKALHFDKLK